MTTAPDRANPNRLASECRFTGRIAKLASRQSSPRMRLIESIRGLSREHSLRIYHSRRRFSNSGIRLASVPGAGVAGPSWRSWLTPAACWSYHVRLVALRHVVACRGARVTSVPDIQSRAAIDKAENTMLSLWYVARRGFDLRFGRPAPRGVTHVGGTVGPAACGRNDRP